MGTWFVGALLALASLVSCATATFDGGYSGAPVPDTASVKSDLPYIRCGACEVFAKHAFRIVKTVNGTLKPGKRLDELTIVELVERMADPSRDEGDWIKMIDLVEEGDKLKLVEHMEIGRCGEECKTIQRAIDDILATHDTDVAEKLWQGTMSRSQFNNWLCYELTEVCTVKPPPLPKYRKPGPTFEVDPKFAQMQMMMANMKAKEEKESAGQMDAAAEPSVDDIDPQEAATESIVDDNDPWDAALESSVEVSSKAKDAAGAAEDQAKKVNPGPSGKADEGASDL